MTFDSLPLAAPILQALTEEGYTTPTPIQAQSIPIIISGKDLLGVAQTGTGKTAAFAVPVLHLLHTAQPDQTRRGPAKPRALVLSPTRELATQIADSFATYGRHTALSHACIYGGVSQFHQTRQLHRGVDILVATPGRLEDLMEQRHVDLSQITILILDEADRMLDMGFIQPIRRIASVVPKGRQTLMFSATMAREIRQLADTLLTNPQSVNIAPVASTSAQIEQSIYHVPRSAKQSLLIHLINESQTGCAIVFTKTKFGADRVERKLRSSGISSVAIHGNKAQNQRQRALDAFKNGRTRVLVATDVAARGLDVDGITHVFNYDLPNEPDAYVHRIGRTGRAGATGIAIGFCDPDERYFLRNIERTINRRINTVDVPQEVMKIAADERATEQAGDNDGDNRRGGGDFNRGGRYDNNRRPERVFENRGRTRFDRSSAPHGDRRPSHRNDAPIVNRSTRFEQKPADRTPARSDDAALHPPHKHIQTAPTHTPAHAPAARHTPHHAEAPKHTIHTPKPHAPKPHAPQAHAPKPHAAKPHAPKPHAPKPHAHAKPVIHTKPHAPKPHTPTPHTAKAHAPKPHAAAPHTPKPHAPAKPHAPKPHTAATPAAHKPKHKVPARIYTERPPEGQPLGPRRFGKKTYAAKKPFGSKTSTPRPAGAKSFGQKKTFNKSFSKARPR
jgi:ATP-dependent RNA helicase RhlE